MNRQNIYICVFFFICITIGHILYTPLNAKNTIDDFDLTGYDILVVGAGLSGAVIAERHANVYGHRVLIIDKRDHIGGNCYDYMDPSTGILVNKYGAHLFHTNNQEVWDYVNKFSPWERWDHRVLAYVDNKYIPVPVNINTVNALLNTSIQNYEEMDQWLAKTQIQYPGPIRNSEEMALSRVGAELYKLIFQPYTIKQWNTSAENLAPEVIARIPIRNDFDDRYFSDRYQALPKYGYTHFFRKILHHPLITVRTGLDYFTLKNKIHAKFLHTYYTGPIDHFFHWEHPLEYRSLRFEQIIIHNHIGYFQPASVVNYPSLDYPYTRIVEYKHFLHQKSKHTILMREYSSDHGEPYYPVPTKRNQEIYANLVQRTKEFKNITFLGRLANYKYFNMDEAIANALQVFSRYSFHDFISYFVEAVGQKNTVSTLEDMFMKEIQPLLQCKQSTILYSISDKSYMEAISHFQKQHTKFDVPCAIMIALDNETYHACTEKGIPVFFWPLSNLRLSYVIGVIKAIVGWAILRNNKDVLFSEMDVFWHKSPLQYIDRTVEHSFSAHSYHPECNLGFYFSRSTQNTIDFYHRILEYMISNKDYDFQAGAMDQKVFDFALRGTSQAIPQGLIFIPPANYTSLPHDLFWHNMGDDWRSASHENHVTLHLSFGIGSSTNRIAAAKTLGLFYGD